jgi:hypothetical protein
LQSTPARKWDSANVLFFPRHAVSLCCTVFTKLADAPLQTKIWFDIPVIHNYNAIWAVVGAVASNPDTFLQSSRWLWQLDFRQYTR